MKMFDFGEKRRIKSFGVDAQRASPHHTATRIASTPAPTRQQLFVAANNYAGRDPQMLVRATATQRHSDTTTQRHVARASDNACRRDVRPTLQFSLYTYSACGEFGYVHIPLLNTVFRNEVNGE